MFVMYTYDGDFYISSEEIYKSREKHASDNNLKFEYISRSDDFDYYYIQDMYYETKY
jgi:uncharacterized protein YpmB